MKLKKYLRRSIILHLIGSLLLLIGPFGFQQAPETKIVWVSLPKGTLEEYSAAMKKAENLPKSTIQEQKLPPTKEPPKKKTAPPEKKSKIPLVAQKKKPKQKQKSEFEKALESLDKRLKTEPPKGAEPEAAQIEKSGEGTKYGTSDKPILVPPNDPEYIMYQAKVRYKILQEWVLPLAYVDVETPPTARILVLIDETGKITSQTWDRSSRNPAFDASCQRAIQRASPLPVPPERLQWEAFNEGFLIEFDPSLKEG